MAYHFFRGPLCDLLGQRKASWKNLTPAKSFVTPLDTICGVLAIFLLLFSVSQGVPVGIQVPARPEENPVIEVTEEGRQSSDQPSIQVKKLRFVNDHLTTLNNRCDLPPLIDEERRAEFVIELNRIMSVESRNHLQDAEQMLNQSFTHECTSLPLPNLQNTPTLEELEAMNHSDGLAVIYSSILRHMVHAYFVQHQLNTSSSCSDVINNERIRDRKYEELATKQKYLACQIRRGATGIGYPHDYTDMTEQVREEELTNLTLCSRRATRDCQVLKSTMVLLDIVNKYRT